MQIADGGTYGVFGNIGNGLYAVGFSVKSDTYGMSQPKDMVTQQWTGTNLFQQDVGSAGNWRVLSVTC